VRRGIRAALPGTGAWPGLAAAAGAVAAAWAVHLAMPQLPMLTVAVVLGILTANLPGLKPLSQGAWQPGLGYAARRLMRLGIVLLGLKLSLLDVAALGWQALAVVAGVVLLTFFGTLALGKAMRLPGDQPLLVAAGFAICGASAIGALSAVTRTSHRDTITPIALVTLCGTLAIAVLPALQAPLGLADEAFGYWVGAGVHDVGQVVATAQTAGAAALAAAVVIKLTRVLMLAPMVTGTALVLRWRHRRRQNGNDAGTHLELPPLLPLFVAGFLAMIVVRTLGILPAGALEAAAVAQDLLLAAALFGLGAAVDIRALILSSGRAIGLAFAAWVLVAALAYGGVLLLG
jgi:uncharacterized integral membrane protein (TIGR00698 family)